MSRWLDSVISIYDKFILSRYLYGIGEDTIEDSEYNNILKFMQTNNYLPEYTSRSWSSDPVPVDLLKKYGREDLARKILLTDRTESIPSVGTESELQEQVGNVFEPGKLSQKFDGWNTQHTYSANGDYKMTNTRGRASDPMLIDNFTNDEVPRHIDTDKVVTVVGEATLSDENFEKIKKMYPSLSLVSSRAAVHTAFAHKEAISLLSFHAFQIKGIDDANETIRLLKKWGFKTPKFVDVNSFDELKDKIQEFSDDESIKADPTDGLVYWKNRGGYRRAIRLARWKEIVYSSYVTGYNESPNTHFYSQSVSIYPVWLGGQTQRQVNITNWARIVSNNLVIGAPIAFSLRSHATADIDEGATKLLQDKYYNNTELFKYKIQSRESNKK